METTGTPTIHGGEDVRLQEILATEVSQPTLHRRSKRGRTCRRKMKVHRSRKDGGAIAGLHGEVSPAVRLSRILKMKAIAIMLAYCTVGGEAMIAEAQRIVN